ncbi:MAG: PSD1 and planctomycete cytochrome C domain-containing protein [Lentisphaeraceae bacterium]|nr:PSD1 and planctomycete cytochrome C domain-containing protein [Lentisphaeraceae bacterium]
MKLLLTILLLACVSIQADLSYTKDIRPILSDKCFKCHGFDDETRDADLRLDTYAGATADLGGYQAVTPGNIEKSELIKRILTHDEDDAMPPKGDRLSEKEVKLIKSWIENGAPYEKHWAYRTIEKPKTPEVKTSWARSDIDKFIANKLPKNLQLSDDADPAILLRRLSLDLTGLPPKLEDVLAFEKDPSEENYEKFIDQYLAAKSFGERWAVFWLDLARYADSNAYQHDQRRTVWPYRDWVIKALNDDMTFDQFTIEQLAGDLLPNPTRKQLIATAFNRVGPLNLSGGSKVEETRYDLAKDRINTVGTVYLGATLECAQCHNHKFDPITQKEYYKLLAYFRPAEDRTYPLNNRGALKRVFGGELILDSYPIDQPDHDKFSKELIQLGTEAIKAKRISDLIHQGLREKDPKIDYIAKAKKLSKVTSEMVKETYDSNAEHRMWIMRDVEKADKTHVLKRGNYLTPGDEVEPGTPGVLHPVKKSAKANRLELANWLIDQNNPLTARVMVNRFWNELFGRGLVSTTEDFGFQGELPSHPQLLDWLADDFKSHWSIKTSLKKIVLSSTYRQNSNFGKASQSDPHNIYLSHGPRQRLAAEFIRDNLLAISGNLSSKMGGAPVYPPQPDGLWDEILMNYDTSYPTSTGDDIYRRSVYVIWRRGSLFPGFSTFDAPVRTACVSQRSRTNTPLQALLTLNEPVLIEAATNFAKRIKDHSGTDQEKITWAFRTSLSRKPSKAELQILSDLLASKKLNNKGKIAELDQSLERYSKNEFLLALNEDELPWFYIAHTLMNLDEVIRKR